MVISSPSSYVMYDTDEDAFRFHHGLVFVPLDQTNRDYTEQELIDLWYKNQEFKVCICIGGPERWERNRTDLEDAPDYDDPALSVRKSDVDEAYMQDAARQEGYNEIVLVWWNPTKEQFVEAVVPLYPQEKAN